MTLRRIAGWVLLSLTPASLIALAALAGQLVELAFAVVFVAVIGGAAWAGLHLIDGGRKP